MKIVTIELIDGYFIEVDELNHTLKQRYIGETKEGEKKPAERIIGYFPNVRACVERIVRLIPLDENDGKVISMREYAKAAEKAFKRVPVLKVDEIVKQLSSAAFERYDNEGMGGQKVVDLDDVIQIVKAG